ncbi:hypothetical protein NFJ02_11g04930 [Pycnococcus provasolii]
MSSGDGGSGSKDDNGVSDVPYVDLASGAPSSSQHPSSAAAGNKVRRMNWQQNVDLWVYPLRHLDMMDGVQRPWNAKNKLTRWNEIAKAVNEEDVFKKDFSLSGKAMRDWFDKEILTKTAENVNGVWERTGDGDRDDGDEDDIGMVQSEVEDLWHSLHGKWTEDHAAATATQQNIESERADERARIATVNGLVDATRAGVPARQAVLGAGGAPHLASPPAGAKRGGGGRRSRSGSPTEGNTLDLTGGDTHDLTGLRAGMKRIEESQLEMAKAKKMKAEEMAADGAHRRALERERWEEDKKRQEQQREEAKEERRERAQERKDAHDMNAAMMSVLGKFMEKMDK